MLKISKALNAGQVQAYHKREYTNPTQSYYNQGGSVKGEWQGQLSASFGLSGEVSQEAFARLSEGQHPETERQMVKHRTAKEYSNPDGTTTKSAEHRSAWDATFSPSKSISLTALVGGDERIREAHREAVTIALGELEKYTQARIGGNNPGETTGKFIAAKFEHDTARPVDGYAAPQLHTHAVIFNVTERPDGSTRALQEKPFFESQEFVTAVYQAELTYRLRKLGYEIEAGKSGAPEIKGYTREYLEASSLRTQQIQDELERTGYSGPKAAQIAAHSTRERKQTLSPGEVLSAHKTLAAQFGNQPEQVIAAAARERNIRQKREPARNQSAKEAVTFARNSVFEREAVVDERVILRDALRRGMGEATYAQVRAEFNVREENGGFIPKLGAKYDSGRKFTTPETIANERANVSIVLKGQSTVEPILSTAEAKAQARSRDFLNPKQQVVIEEVLQSRDRVHGLQGLAGTGKTTALAAIREGAEKGGYTVEGFAPASKAAGALRDAGVSATTLQSFIARRKEAPDPDIKRLYMLDESSLTSSRDMRSFLERIGPNDRVLVIGDTRQHQAVDAGRPFQQMQEAGMRTAQLDQIVRQRNAPELLEAVQHLASGEVKTGIQMLADQGRVVEIANPKDRISAIAKDYANRPEQTIIVSPDNRSRQQINEAVRVELLAKGTLASDGRELRTLVQRSELTGAERTWAARYDTGDVLQYRRGSKSMGIEQNSFATVRSVNAQANTLTVELQDGKMVSYDPKRLQGVSAYREVTREFATGDRIQFTAQKRNLGVANRDLGTITRIALGEIVVRLDGKAERSVSFDPNIVRGFDHGYAVTSHSSQGLTVNRVIANMDTDSSRFLINTRLAYVAVSRAEQDARIYTNNATTLGDRLAVDISKTAAVDFRQRPAPEPQKEREPAREERETSPQPQRRAYEYAAPEHRLAAVAQDYSSRPEKTIVIAQDRSEREELTQLIRTDLYAQGRLAREAREVPVLVERTLSNSKLAANYEPGERIQYRTGSPRLEGIPHNSIATVVSNDPKSNILTVETEDRSHASYNPLHFRTQTRESRVYRQETREIASGERIILTASHPEHRIRQGDLATVEKIANNNALTVRLDKGGSVELSPDQARHIEYGYAVGSTRRISADRVIATGESFDQKSLAAATFRTRDLTLYTSAETIIRQKEQPETLKAVSIPEVPRQSMRQLQDFGLGF